MIELHACVAKYNTINIATTGVLLVTQSFNLTLWLSWYLLLLDDDTINTLLFWPVSFLLGIIQLNKSLLRKFIHNQNKQIYEANNVNIDKFLIKVHYLRMIGLPCQLVQLEIVELTRVQT